MLGRGKYQSVTMDRLLHALIQGPRLSSDFTMPLLPKIFVNELYEKYWNMTKEDVEQCKDCEYRYICFDCRPN